MAPVGVPPVSSFVEADTVAPTLRDGRWRPLQGIPATPRVPCWRQPLRGTRVVPRRMVPFEAGVTSSLDLYVTIWLHTDMQALATLGDPVRREIVEVLLDHPEDAGTLASRFPISRPAVSRHLRVLREAGLVRSETVAQRRIYHVEPEPLRAADDWIQRHRAFWTERLDALTTHLEEHP